MTHNEGHDMPNETLGQEIKRKREAIGWTQAWVASLLELDTGTISRWERDVWQPSPDNLASLKYLLGRRWKRRPTN
jgi:transcriptional regulator with XRE-family HTH domain